MAAGGMLDRITPVVLTLNEAPNIGRSLAALSWAREIVVVDSFSTDETIAIAEADPRVRLIQRPFVNHEDQWTFAVHGTGIASDWVMRLDADYILPPATVAEIAALSPTDDVAGYRSRFVYCVHGRRLRASLYPPRPRLFRRAHARFYQDGHTEEVALDGRILDLAQPILHDDRKPLSQWIAGQRRYMALEAEKLAAAPPGSLGLADRIRLHRWMAPPLVLLYCLFGRGLVLDGWAGLYYTYQRTAAECLLALYLMDRRLAGDPPAD